MRKIGINLDAKKGIAPIEYIKMAHEVGFGAMFTGVPDERELYEIANALAAHGMSYDTMHAPFDGINQIWMEGEQGERMLARLLQAVDRCHAASVPITVVHLSSGKTPPAVSAVGSARYERLVEHAAAKGVKIAFENQRQLENLTWAFRHFEGAENVGFCFDCGHEGCFTPGLSFMPIFGKRLICTHLHDNSCLPDQDLHQLPFDGKLSFGRVASSLRESGYQGTLMLECFAENSDKYTLMSCEQYLAAAAIAAKRLRRMVDGFEFD